KTVAYRLPWELTRRVDPTSSAMLPPFRVNRVHPVVARLPHCARSHRSQHHLVHDHTDLTAQEVKQHGDALAIGHAFEQPEASREHAVDDAHLVARRELGSARQTNEAMLVLTRLEILNDAGGYARWLFAVENKVRDAESRSDRPPLLPRKVKSDKK